MSLIIVVGAGVEVRFTRHDARRSLLASVAIGMQLYVLRRLVLHPREDAHFFR